MRSMRSANNCSARAPQVRSYQQYLVAETDMGAEAGVASGGGFQEALPTPGLQVAAPVQCRPFSRRRWLRCSAAPECVKKRRALSRALTPFVS